MVGVSALNSPCQRQQGHTAHKDNLLQLSTKETQPHQELLPKQAGYTDTQVEVVTLHYFSTVLRCRVLRVAV